MGHAHGLGNITALISVQIPLYGDIFIFLTLMMRTVTESGGGRFHSTLKSS